MMQATYINQRQPVRAEENAGPHTASAYADEVSKLSASLTRLNDEIQHMESALAPALRPTSFAGEDAAVPVVKPVAAPLIDTLENYALHANSLACQVSALRSRLCF